MRYAKALTRSHLGTAALLFCITGTLIYLRAGDRLIFEADEGIYLDGGIRVASGQVPYRDFFVLTGPGTFWLLGGIFRITGATLSHARLLLVADLALIAVFIYLMSARLARPALAVAISVVFVASVVYNRNQLEVNHRWDSSAAICLSIGLAATLTESSKPLQAAVAGLFAAAACWITPSVLLIGGVLAAYIYLQRSTRRLLTSFLLGYTLAAVVPAAVLLAQGGLQPLIRSMVWAARNYSGPNRLAYGSIFGGYSSFLAGAQASELLFRLILLSYFVMSAIFPVVNFIAWPVRIWRGYKPRNEILLLLAGSAALLISAYPRMDAMHLVPVSPISFVLMAGLINSAPFAIKVACATLACPLLILGASVLRYEDMNFTVPTGLGVVRANRDDYLLTARLLQSVHADDELFVYPYAPIFYPLTRAENPTRYSFLQPGMMTGEDEDIALAGLQAKPPQWLLYRNSPAGVFLRLWPSSDVHRLRLNKIEDFIQTHCRQREILKHPEGDYALLSCRG